MGKQTGFETLAHRPLALGLALALSGGTLTVATASPHLARLEAAGINWLKLDPTRAGPELRPAIEQAWAAHRLAHAGHATRPATVLPVGNCDDDGSPGSLRAVLETAVAGDTIELQGLTCGVISLAGASLQVNVDSLTIHGPGADLLAIDAGGASNLIDFFGSGEANASGTLTITGLALINGAFDGAYTGGGAIWAMEGHDLVISGSRLSNSLATGPDVAGGAIFAMGNVTLERSTVSDNQVLGTAVDALGGGIFAQGDLTLIDSTVSGNLARADQSDEYCDYYDPQDCSVYPGAGRGGGVFAAGTLTIGNSTISGNAAADGGGVFAADALTIRNSTISDNEASVANRSADDTRPIRGGGLLTEGPSFRLDSSIVFGNRAPTPGADLVVDAGGPNVTGDHNLVGSANAGFAVPPSSANPQLGPLDENGGPTRTHALQAGSPAINAGTNPAALAYDQRGSGFNRVVGAAADIGAFEVQTASGPMLFKDGFEG